jgi:hypothetical protein
MHAAWVEWDYAAEDLPTDAAVDAVLPRLDESCAVPRAGGPAAPAGP